jgi:CheY-like chemotaxis protein/HPt (histidine-containing phosphotransfer) domain-containing protein
MQLAQEIRADPLLAGVHLIMLTSIGLRLNTEDWRSVGADAHLVKPLRRTRLRDALLRVLGLAPAVSPAPLDPGTQHLGRLGLRVLVAEDNPVNQKIAFRQLRKLGCTADPVANGLEAIDAVRRIPYDVVLMDCQMPELDGYEATRRIRKLEPELARLGRASTPIIAMTANALGGDRTLCLEAGMDDYITKPVRLPDLQAALLKIRARMPSRRSGASSPQQPRGGDEPAIDPAFLAGLRTLQAPGEPDAVAELAELFLRDAPPRVERIHGAIADRDPVALREAAHGLKGSANNLGARRLAFTCDRIETAARLGDLPNASIAAGELDSEFGRVRFLLEQEAKNQNSAGTDERS